MSPTLILLGLVVFLFLGVSLWLRPLMGRQWRECALRHPVLILESDDWGPGPSEDAAVLLRIAQLLAEFEDSRGRAPVMTLGIVLAVADVCPAAPGGGYRQLTLRDEACLPVRNAMLAGKAAGVFALQLHGMEHYWPEALMAAAGQGGEAARWLAGPEFPRSEALPSPLQSRWVDASVLPARDHAPESVAREVRAEVEEFTRTFGERPVVVVPPTFLWTDAVERAWADCGLQVLVCPGRQFIGRDAQGGLVAGRGPLANGERGPGGLTYVVRDAYFEPERGHRAEDAIRALRERTAAARPTLLEIHRSNFIGPEEVRERSLQEISRLLTLALRELPDLRFTTTAELARALAERDPDWVHVARPARLAVFLQRLRTVPRVGRLMRWSGLGWLAQRLADTLLATPGPRRREVAGSSSAVGRRPAG